MTSMSKLSRRSWSTARFGTRPPPRPAICNSTTTFFSRAIVP